MKQKRPLFISITGNIGTGKSLIAEILSKNGIAVYSADVISHQILKEKEVIEDLRDIFGKEIFTDNALDEKKLRDLVFKDKDNLKKLNSFLHKKILIELQNILDGYSYQPPSGCTTGRSRSEINYNNPIFFEIPLLFECNLETCFDLNIVVATDEDLLIQRVVTRDNCSKEQVLSIIDKQIPLSQIIDKADLVLLNNSTLDVLEIQLKLFMQLMKFIKKRKIRRLIV